MLNSTDNNFTHITYECSSFAKDCIVADDGGLRLRYANRNETLAIVNAVLTFGYHQPSNNCNAVLSSWIDISKQRHAFFKISCYTPLRCNIKEP